jgi:hypothetical protein
MNLHVLDPGNEKKEFNMVIREVIGECRVNPNLIPYWRGFIVVRDEKELTDEGMFSDASRERVRDT